MPVQSEEKASFAGLPVDLLRLILSNLLCDFALDAYPLVKTWQSFALVCKSWMDAARSTTLRIRLNELLELDDDVIDWLSGVTLEELELDPEHFTVDLFRHRPQFVQRSGHSLRRLIGAQLSAEPEDAIIPAEFPQLEELDLHADSDPSAEHRFDSACLESLQQLRILTLSDFISADLSHLPTTLEQLDLFVYQNEPLELPSQLRLSRLAVTGNTMYINWPVLCRQVSEYLAITAPVITLLLPDDAVSNQQADATMELLTSGFVKGVVTHAEMTLNVLCLAQRDPNHADTGDDSWRELEFDPANPMRDPRYRQLHCVQQMQVAEYLQETHSRHFGTFCQVDTPETEEEIGLVNGTRFELVRHSEGEPLQLGFANELPQHQIDFLLSGVQVRRLALDQVPAHQVATILNSPAFQEASASTLKLLEGVNLDPGLDLWAYEALEELVAYLGPRVEQGPDLLPRNLVRLEICGNTDPADMTPEAMQTLELAIAEAHEQGFPPPPLPPPPHLCLDAGITLMHCWKLQELCVTAVHDMDLSKLPPSVEVLMVQDPDFQQSITQAHPDSYTLSLPRELPPGMASREIKYHFSEAAPAGGGSRLAPVVELDEVLGGWTHVGITVEEEHPPSDLEEGEDDGGILERQGWVLTVTCRNSSLPDVMAAVTVSPLQSITFDAAEVCFQSDEGGPSIGSLKMQEYVESNWGHCWRVIPMDTLHSDTGSELEKSDDDDVDEEGEAGEAVYHGFHGRQRFWPLSDVDGESDEDVGSSDGYVSRGDAFTLKRR